MIPQRVWTWTGYWWRFVDGLLRCRRWRIMKALQSLIMSRLSGLVEGSELRRWKYALWGVWQRWDWAVFITCSPLIMLSAWAPPPPPNLCAATSFFSSSQDPFSSSHLSFLLSIIILWFPIGRFLLLQTILNRSRNILSLYRRIISNRLSKYFYCTRDAFIFQDYSKIWMSGTLARLNFLIFCLRETTRC